MGRPVRIIVCGSRKWTDRWFFEQAMRNTLGPFVDLNELTIVHGACPTGADQMADEWARRRSVNVERYPADWKEHGKAAGPIRNALMASKGADLCIAFLLPDGKSRGTTNMIRCATDAGIPVRVPREVWI